MILLLLLVGCATSTIESRRQEKMAIYQTLSPETKALVDKGQIKVGMPMEAVYISWGAPSQIVQGENEFGRTTMWLYQGSYLEQYRYWNYREVRLRDGRKLSSLTAWRTLSSPQ